MNDMNTYKGYHATPSRYVDVIKKEGFKFYRNDEHWLGNGIYFFSDPYLAKWWSKTPTKKFGSSLPNKKILYVEITAFDDDVCDLRTLKDYFFCAKQYAVFCKEMEDSGEPIQREEITRERLRCMYFDWLVDRFKTKACIASFFKPNPGYLEIGQMNYESFNKIMGIPYNEEQLCVFEKDIIHNIDIYDIKESEYNASVCTRGT